MYLVEQRPGKEELYRTGDELAAAIRNGDVDMHSRIYHRATSKWISVTLHPQYKAIVSDRPASAPPAPAERASWTFFNDSADTLAGANAPDANGSIDLEDGDDSDPNWRRPLALSVAGVLLLLGLQLAASGQRPPWASRDAGASGALHPGATVAERAPSPSVAYAGNNERWLGKESYAPNEAPAAVERKESAASLIPAAPRLSGKALLKEVKAEKPAPTANPSGKPTVTSMVGRWSAAHDSAGARLESGMRVVRLNQLFSTGRLSPGGGVTETRLGLAGAANFVRVYRQQQTAIDRDYQKSFSAAAKQQGWSPDMMRVWHSRTSKQEPATLAALTTSLIDGIDSLLGVLDAQAGTYTLTPNTIKFEDPSAAKAYTSLRERINATVTSAKAAGGQDQPGPMSYLLQAIGATRLPLAT
ncbi:MAG: hypothetical protein ABI860_03020 [Gemmatimonadales bacterium]